MSPPNQQTSSCQSETGRSFDPAIVNVALALVRYLVKRQPWCLASIFRLTGRTVEELWVGSTALRFKIARKMLSGVRIESLRTEALTSEA